MTPEEQAVADAAAKAVADKATADAAAKAKDPVYLEAELKKVIAERDAHKAKVKELTPAAIRLKEIEDASKTEVQRLTDKIATLEPGAARTVALEARIQAILDESMADLTDAQKAAVRGDTPEAKLEHLQAMRAAGLFGEPAAGRSIGGELPRKGGASTIKGEDLVKGDDVGAFDTNRASLKAGKTSLA